MDAWKAIVENPEKRKAYHSARGKGGFRRCSWQEILELIRPQHREIYTLSPKGEVIKLPKNSTVLDSNKMESKFINLSSPNSINTAKFFLCSWIGCCHFFQ